MRAGAVAAYNMFATIAYSEAKAAENSNNPTHIQNRAILKTEELFHELKMRQNLSLEYKISAKNAGILVVTGSVLDSKLSHLK